MSPLPPLRSSRALAAGLLLALAANPARAATESSTSSATVVTPIAISKEQDQNFGRFAPGAGGSLVLSPAGLRSATGGVVLFSGGGVSAASFSVSGDPGAGYSIALPLGATVTHSSGASMTVGSFTSNPTLTGTLSLAGSQRVDVGATLSVNAGQPAGSYTGSFTVAVEYQ